MTTSTTILLTSWDCPYLAEYIEAMHDTDVPISAIVCAGEFDSKDKAIVHERTKGYFKPRAVFDMSLAEIPFHFVKSHNSLECRNLLQRLRPELLINAGTPNILKRDILQIPLRGVLNSHPGFLPDYRGCTCLEWAIFNDDLVGATCHFMNADIDSGPIILSRLMGVTAGTPYEKVRADMILHMCHVMAEGARKVLNEDGVAASYPMPQEGRYWKVIPADHLAEVKRKLLAGAYTQESDCTLR